LWKQVGAPLQELLAASLWEHAAPLWELSVAPLWKQVGAPLEELLTASLWEHAGAPSWNMKEALDIEQGYSDKSLKALLLEMIALLLELKLCPIWIEDL
jgi:hypothetical protein